MDHYPTFSRPHLQQRLEELNNGVFKIAWLGFPHDASIPVCTFKEYPLKHGWTEEEVASLFTGGSWEDRLMTTMMALSGKKVGAPAAAGLPRPPEECLAMLQSWLIFGVTEDFLKSKVPKELFVVQGSVNEGFFAMFNKLLSVGIGTQQQQQQAEESSVVNLAKLRGLLVGWRRQVMVYTMAESTAESTRLQKLFEDARPWQYAMARMSALNKALSHLPEYNNTVRIHAILCESLDAARSSMDSEERVQNQAWNYTIETRDLLLKMLVDRGWCPSTVRMMSMRFRNCVREYANMMAPPAAFGEEPGAHKICTDDRCKVREIDEATYEPRHRVDYAPCSPDLCTGWVKPDAAEIMSIIRKWRIPILHLGRQIVRAIATEVELDGNVLWVDPDSDDVPKYVAISHVWSDGLGSTTETGLPICQVNKLLARTRASADAGLRDVNYVWIDSLCIPADPETRKMAIGTMNKTFKLAHATIVVDGALETMSLANCLTEELVISVATSGWMQRVWTLPEGLMSKTLYIAFKDSVFPFVHLLAAIQGSWNPNVPHPGLQGYENAVAQAILLDFGLIWEYERGPRGKKKGLLELHRALQFRQTSKAGDELIAVSAAMGLDTLAIQDAPVGKKMVKFLQMLGTIPIGIPFLEVEKVTEEGYTWAPKTFLTRLGDPSLGSPMITTAGYDEFTATVTPSGLLGEFHVLRPFMNAGRFSSYKGWGVDMFNSGRTFMFYDARLEDPRAAEDAEGAEAYDAEICETALECDAIIISPMFPDMLPDATGIAVTKADFVSPEGTTGAFKFGKMVAVYEVNEAQTHPAKQDAFKSWPVIMLRGGREKILLR